MKKAASFTARIFIGIGIVIYICLTFTAAASVGDISGAGNTLSVSTPSGSYNIVRPATDVFKTSKGNAYNIVALRKGTTEIGYGYAVSGKQDILKNSRNEVFVAGGGSTWDVMRLSSNYTYTQFPEKAELNIWSCEDSMMNGMKAQKQFSVASTNGYSYYKSVMSGDVIKSTFVGQKSDGTYAVEVFSFDTVTKTWSNTTEKRVVSSLSDLQV